MTPTGKKVVESVKARADMPKSAVLGFAAKMRSHYKDDKAADALETIAAKRTDPPPPPEPPRPFYCEICCGSLCEHTPG